MESYVYLRVSACTGDGETAWLSHERAGDSSYYMSPGPSDTEFKNPQFPLHHISDTTFALAEKSSEGVG